MARYKLDMAGIRWDITTPFEIVPDDTIIPFFTDEEETDIWLSFQEGIPDIPGEILWKRYPKVWKDESHYWVERTLTVKANASGCICIDAEDPSHVEGWIYPEHRKDINALDKLLDISELEVLLTQFSTVSLHSSLVRWRNHGILFTAPSGTGKSTQADLWEEYRSAEILNGDRSMIRWEKGVWNAYGSPFAGTSGIFKNASAPIGAIIVLRQAKENSLTQLNPAEAFRLLYSETVIPKWHQEAHETIIQLVMRLASEVPVMMLHCRPDQTAVKMLNQYLDTLSAFQSN